MKKFLLVLIGICFVSSSFAGTKCDRTPEGYETNCVHIPGWKDPALTITEEDMKGMVYVTPEQERAFKKKQFEQALENEITARMYQDRVPTREQAIQEILAGVPRKVR